MDFLNKRVLLCVLSEDEYNDLIQTYNHVCLNVLSEDYLILSNNKRTVELQEGIINFIRSCHDCLDLENQIINLEKEEFFEDSEHSIQFEKHVSYMQGRRDYHNLLEKLYDYCYVIDSNIDKAHTTKITADESDCIFDEYHIDKIIKHSFDLNRLVKHTLKSTKNLGWYCGKYGFTNICLSQIFYHLKEEEDFPIDALRDNSYIGQLFLITETKKIIHVSFGKVHLLKHSNLRELLNL